MIPRWKIAREPERLGPQFRAIAAMVREPVVQRNHDRNRAARVTVTEGRRPLRDNVVICLVFQPYGISPSTIETCKMLEERGYAVLVVSNAPLGADVTERLASVAWRVMERPNYGYDFGGYRDGILHLLDEGHLPDRLIVMNDSIWYPLAAVETLTRRRMTRVIESCLCLFSAKAIRSPAFRSFWQGCRMSSIKYNAAHRGERRIAEAMLPAGLSADGLFGREELFALMASRSPGCLRKTLDYSNGTNDAFEASGLSLLSEFSPVQEWNEKAVQHIQTVSAKHSFFASFPFACFDAMEIPLIKRTSAALQILARKAALLAIAAGMIRTGGRIFNIRIGVA